MINVLPALPADQSSRGINRRHMILMLIGVPLYFALCLFLPAGRWNWLGGWLFTVICVVASAAVLAVLWRINPEVVVARSHSHTGTKRWDRILLWFLFPFMWSIVPVAAWDVGRFHGTTVSVWVCAIGYGLFLGGMGLTTWAEAVNKFFEVTVRIQAERGHTVIDTGPYAIVRHPGYVGALAMAFGIALALGSLYALIPAGITSLLFLLRTHWEDQTLQQELPGYQEYSRRVRYKFIVGVW